MIYLYTTECTRGSFICLASELARERRQQGRVRQEYSGNSNTSDGWSPAELRQRGALGAQRHGDDGGGEAKVKGDEKCVEESGFVLENEDRHTVTVDVVVARPYEHEGCHDSHKEDDFFGGG